MSRVLCFVILRGRYRLSGRTHIVVGIRFLICLSSIGVAELTFERWPSANALMDAPSIL